MYTVTFSLKKNSRRANPTTFETKDKAYEFMSNIGSHSLFASFSIVYDYGKFHTVENIIWENRKVKSWKSL